MPKIVFLPLLSQNWGQISGSGGDDVALCVAAAEDSVAIAGYTTGALYIDENGKTRRRYNPLR